MSSSLPVPSKAALTALRGLVVGTSCTLALIAEDRRRKIDNAVRVIENGARIKSAKGYRPGGAALAVAIEEDALWDSGLGSIPRVALALQPRTLQHNTRGIPSDPSRERKNHGGGLHRADEVDKMMEAPGIELANDEIPIASEQSGTSSTDNPSPPAQLARSSRLVRPPKPAPIRPLPELTTSRQTGPSWLWNNLEVIQSYSFPTSDEIVAMVQRACGTKEPHQIATALRTVFEAMDHRVAPDNLNRPWIEATAWLCRTCQEEGRLDDAATLLYRIVCRGPMEESAYLSHEPFTLIESLLARAELNKETRDSYTTGIDNAVNLFVPKFIERPTGTNPQVFNLGRRLLELCFSADRLQRIFGIYRRCNLIPGEDSNDLTVWFLTKLYEKQDYTSVVKIFISTFPQSSPTEASVHALGDLVVDCVELAHNHRPEEVLKTLHSVCTSLGNTKLSPKWVMKLLTSHWKKHGNFGEIEALFEGLQTPRLKDSVFRSENIYRIMVELALEAGEEAKADSYFELAVSHKRALATDVRLLGVFARFHAADGDWEAVRADFEAMNQRGKPSDGAYGRIFVPVLKAYAETHTVRETEEFLKFYTDEFGVPLCSYTVTLMAKQYAAIRDVSSLIEWLDYCSRAKFPVDAAFTNSILVRCRRQWKLPFRELRTLFRKIRALNPGFVDKHTAQVMADAACSDSKYGGKAAKGRLLSLRVDPNQLAVTGRNPQDEDVVLAMKGALSSDLPRRAVWIYKRAVHLNTPFSQHTLRLAVQAHLTSAPNDYEGAYELIRAAQSKGEDVNPIINYLLAQQLSNLTSSITNPSEADATIQRTLAQYRRAGIQLTEVSLHRAATACLAAGHFRIAISYALKAADVRGGPSGGQPCFNLQNFKILLAAYAALVDVSGLRDTVDRALAHHYREDSACRLALKHACRQVAHSTARAVTPEERACARAVLDEGIGRVVQARRRLRIEAKQLEAEAIRIMRRAALDAGGEEVDFERVPWLGGKGGAAATTGTASRAKKAKEDEADGEGLVEGYYAELERVLLEGSSRAAVEAC